MNRMEAGVVGDPRGATIVLGDGGGVWRNGSAAASGSIRLANERLRLDLHLPTRVQQPGHTTMVAAGRMCAEELAVHAETASASCADVKNIRVRTTSSAGRPPRPERR